MPKGLLLINLGTPQAPTTSAVRKYLREFLMDPEVIDIPSVFRWLLVHAIILPRRPARSAEAYRKVWTQEGSPLLFHHLALTRGVQAHLDRTAGQGEWVVEAGMRYGEPSLEQAIGRLLSKGVSEIQAFPLYPQYSLAATYSSVKRTRELCSQLAPRTPLRFLPAFYESAGFIKAFASIARESLVDFKYDHLLFSFHGLPERQVKKTDSSGAHCLAKANCCDKITDVNRDCYRAQSYATARALARELGLDATQYSVCFQSRLGRTPWIQPYTDQMYIKLAQEGKKRIAVMCPAFVADCLETLEEVQIRGREDFIQLGGEDLKLVPSLNSNPLWIQAVAESVQ